MPLAQYMGQSKRDYSIKNSPINKTTVAIACGNDKTEAIIGALKTSLIDVLITDEYTALELLA